MKYKPKIDSLRHADINFSNDEYNKIMDEVEYSNSKEEVLDFLDKGGYVLTSDLITKIRELIK